MEKFIAAQIHFMNSWEWLTAEEHNAVGDFIRLKLFYDNHILAPEETFVAGYHFTKTRESISKLNPASKKNFDAIVRTPANDKLHLTCV